MPATAITKTEPAAVTDAHNLAKRVEGLASTADDTAVCVALAKVMARRLARAADPSGKLKWASGMIAEMMDATPEGAPAVQDEAAN
jgi:hypothetical protein